MLARTPQLLDVEVEALRDEMVALVPSLRAFAIKLSGSVDRADDLVHDTLVRAMSSLHTFEPGTRMVAWLFVILRNKFRSDYRTEWRTRGEPSEYYADDLRFSAGGEDDAVMRLDFARVSACAGLLPEQQRRALELVAVEGYTYEDAARACGCSAGTIKSRVHRGRRALEQMLEEFARVQQRTRYPEARA